jgi:hypothetical protein
MRGGDDPMTDSVSVLWVDDKDRNEDAKNLASKSLLVSWCHPQELDNKLHAYVETGHSPDLFLVDFALNQTPDLSKSKYPHNGLTAAAIIREKYPEHPVYLATEQFIKDDTPQLTKWSRATEDTFDCILSVKQLQREQKDNQSLYFDALDYKKIRTQTRHGNLKSLLALLNAPDSALEMIELALPDELRKGLATKTSPEQKGNTISFAKWVRGSLTNNPGILYSELYAATLLGVNERGFARISKHFGDDVYSGVFSRAYDTLWWVSALKERLFSFKNARKIKSSDTRLVSQTIFSVQKDQKSKCVVCSELLPDTVGSNIDNPNEVGQVHFKCSIPDPRKRPELYFEGPRVFSRTMEHTDGP